MEGVVADACCLEWGCLPWATCWRLKLRGVQVAGHLFGQVREAGWSLPFQVGLGGEWCGVVMTAGYHMDPSLCGGTGPLSGYCECGRGWRRGGSSYGFTLSTAWQGRLGEVCMRLPGDRVGWECSGVRRERISGVLLVYMHPML